MASLFVHVGQCGNQVALPFWRLAESEAGLPWAAGEAAAGIGGLGGGGGNDPESRARTAASRHPMFDATDGHARCVMVDSEPKVIQSAARSLRTVRPDNVCLDHSGRGNNWAMGFMACAADEQSSLASSSTLSGFSDGGGGGGRGLFSMATEAIRREAERTDCLRSMIMVHSLGGGTGSGVGSALLQHLRDYYPACWLLPVA